MSGPHGFSLPPVFAADRPLVFGHRGGARVGPENTLTAFARALALGADGFECDVRLSADGVPVVIHDATLDRTTDATGPVGARRAVALGAVDARARFVPATPDFAVDAAEGVPTLREVLTRFRTARIIIELKDDSARLAAAVALMLGELDAIHRVCVGSFHQTALDVVRDTAPAVTTSASRREAQWTLARATARWPFGRRPRYRAFQVPERAGRLHVVTPTFVRRAHREGAVVQVWTIDAADDIHRLLAIGVDGIISDRPDLAVPARDAFTRIRGQAGDRRGQTPFQPGHDL